jgi:hypothetical protein
LRTVVEAENSPSCPDMCLLRKRKDAAMKVRIGFCVFWTSFLVPLACTAQTFSTVETHAAKWRCHGRVWIENSALYCKDAHTQEISKTLIDGRQEFARLETPSVGQSNHIIALAEDANQNVYAVDGVNVHIYSNSGKYQRSLTPGINMSFGLAVLDAEHIFVTGRLSPTAGESSATAFLIGSKGIQRSFSMEDHAVNAPSFLALDRGRKLLYQIPQHLYEVRVFDLEGNLRRTIAPPAKYRIRVPKPHHYPDGGVGLDPSDAIGDIAVLPDGGIAVTGDILDHAETQDQMTSVSYSTFVDVYGPDGNFNTRLTGDQLQLEGAHLMQLDSATGKA